MSYLEWEDRLDTGIEVIDGQHKRIVKYINQLYDLNHAENVDSNDVEQIVLKLIDYTMSHFAFEESLMVDSKFSKITEHLKEHDEFSAKVLKFKVEINEKGAETVAEELLEMLKGWLYGHILEEDAEYVPFFKSFMESQNRIANQGWLKQKIRRFFN